MDSYQNTKDPENMNKPAKIPLEDLNRDELIKKCKNLLIIAQKAKTAKVDIQKEVEEYKIIIDKYENEKKAELKSQQALKELIETLTEQKLNYITDLDKAQGIITQLTSKCEQYERDIEYFKSESVANSKATNYNSSLEIENESLKRQNNRLLEENEQLINQLSELEQQVCAFNELGLEQREQLQQLEEVVNKANTQTNEVKNPEVDELKKNMKFLTDELSQKEIVIGNLEKEIKEYDEKITILKNDVETEKEKKEKANSKLRIYRDKIVRCSSLITQLKNSNIILRKTVEDYSEIIPKWQNDLMNASTMISNEIDKVKTENRLLIGENDSLKKSMDNIQKQLLSATEENEELKNNIKQLQNQVNEMRKLYNTPQVKNKIESEETQNLQLQIKGLVSEKLILVKEKQSARDSIIELEAQNKTFSDKIHQLTRTLETLRSQIDNISEEKAILEKDYKATNSVEVNNLKEELNNVKSLYNALRKENEDLADLNNLLKEEVQTLKLSLEQPRDDNLSDLNVSLQADIAKLETKLSAYKQENASLLLEVKESRIKVKECDSLLAEFEETKSKLANYKTENSELLSEMKEINQVLKERGETISKQQKTISEFEKTISDLEKARDSMTKAKEELETQILTFNTMLNEQSAEILRLKSELETSTKIIYENENSMASLREELERMKHAEMATDDNMSTSTISRQEEQNRMRELDDSFEDRYSKLRTYAIKLKKKLTEVTAQLDKNTQEKSKLERIAEESTMIVKNFQKLQQEYDRVVDQLEEATNEIKKIKKENDQHKSSESVDTVSNETVDRLQSQVKTLSDELEAMQKYSIELEQLKAELAQKELLLTVERDGHKATKENLEKAKRDAKKKSVLSLEMEDYERSMKELSTKMEDNKKKMVQMESTIDTQQGTINSMKTQIKLLEEQVKTEEKHTRNAKEEFQSAQEQVKEYEITIRTKNETIAKLEEEIETAKRNCEDLNLEMTSLLAEKEKIVISLGEEKTELLSKLKKTECKCCELEESLRILNIELTELKMEHTSYKVRAQAVLRQSQSADPGQEAALREELAALRAHNDSLSGKLAAALGREAECVSALEGERRRGQEASAEAARAAQRQARLAADVARLAAQLDADRAHHQLQVSTLTQCYKTQISDLEARLKTETEELRKEASVLREQLATASSSRAMPAAPSDSHLLPFIHKDDADMDMDINVTLLPREEGEGSEATASPVGGVLGGRRSPVPLERLLEEGVPEDDVPDAAHALTLDQDLADTKKQLASQIERVKHLTVLLSESERECARLTQLNEVLKAEVRRSNTNLERTTHAHNAEYMKNVTLKFVTLPPGDERSRLVPVLQKILTLNPEETHKLAAVARGADSSSSRGWGSYLPWPGGK